MSGTRTHTHTRRVPTPVTRAGNPYPCRTLDADGRLVDFVTESIPRSLRIYLPEESDSWSEFLANVRSAPIDVLQDARDKQREDKLRDQTIATLQQQLSQLSLQVHTGPNRNTRSTSTMPPTLPTGTTPLATVTTPRPAQSTGWQARVPYVWQLTCTQIMERANVLPHRANTEAGRRQYEQDIKAWHAAHGQNPPSLERPYPLKPGTAPLGSGECFACGEVTDPNHTATLCTAGAALRPHETRWRALISSMLRRAATANSAATAPIPVQVVWPSMTTVAGGGTVEHHPRLKYYG